MDVFLFPFSPENSHFSVKALLTTLFQVITALGMREEYLGCNSEASIKNQLNSSCGYLAVACLALDFAQPRKNSDSVISAVKQQGWLCRALSQQASHSADR